MTISFWLFKKTSIAFFVANNSATSKAVVFLHMLFSSILLGIILKSGIEGENGDYYIIFEFKKLGEQQVKVSLIETLGQVENNITNILNVNVLEEKDITICAKWSAYPIYPNSDGKYYIYLEGNGIRQDSIYFSCMLDEELLYGKTVVYQVLSEDLRLEVDRLFEPQTLGEYIFEIEYEDKLVGQVCVIVA